TNPATPQATACASISIASSSIPFAAPATGQRAARSGSTMPRNQPLRPGTLIVTELRSATADDLPVLETLIARSGRELSAGYYTDAQAEAITRHVFGVDTQLIADQTYFV